MPGIQKDLSDSTRCCNHSRDYNARFTATHRTVSVYRVLQMRGGGYADVLPVLQVPDNKADAVPCERLQDALRPGDSIPYKTRMDKKKVWAFAEKILERLERPF